MLCVTSRFLGYFYYLFVCLMCWNFWVSWFLLGIEKLRVFW